MRDERRKTTGKRPKTELATHATTNARGRPHSRDARRHVDVDDVAVDERAAVRDAVADDLVQATTVTLSC